MWPLAHPDSSGNKDKPVQLKIESYGVGYGIESNQVLSSFQNMAPPTNLLLLKSVFDPSMTGTCRLKIILVGALKFSNPCP